MVNIIIIIAVYIAFIFLNKLEILAIMNLILMILFFSEKVFFIRVIKFIMKNFIISRKMICVRKILVKWIILYFFNKFLFKLRTVLIFKIVFSIFKLIDFLLLSKLPLFGWILWTRPGISRMIILIIILSELLLLKLSSKTAWKVKIVHFVWIY